MQKLGTCVCCSVLFCGGWVESGAVGFVGNYHEKEEDWIEVIVVECRSRISSHYPRVWKMPTEIVCRAATLVMILLLPMCPLLMLVIVPSFCICFNTIYCIYCRFFHSGFEL